MGVEVVLVNPKIAGNVGAVARVMANFGFQNLVILNPGADYLCEEARQRAKHANNILEEAGVLRNWEKLRNRYSTLIATSGKRGSKYNLRRVALSATELSDLIKNKKGDIGLVFGREGIGLTNEEIDRCDFLVSIRTSEKYPVMNLSHSVAVLLYEIYKNRKEELLYEPASREVKDAIIEWLDKILEVVEVDRKGPIKDVFKKILSKSMIKEREAFTIAGLFRNTYNKIKREE